MANLAETFSNYLTATKLAMGDTLTNKQEVTKATLSLLGYYNSNLKPLGWRKSSLLENVTSFSEGVFYTNFPKDHGIVRKIMGLSGKVKQRGINQKKNRRRGNEHNHNKKNRVARVQHKREDSPSKNDRRGKKGDRRARKNRKREASGNQNKSDRQ